MEKFDPSGIIEGSEKLTDIFGYWPSFHDAEVSRFSLLAGEGQFGISPLIEVEIHLWEMTNEVSPTGYYILVKHTLTVIQFEGVRDLQLSGLADQNAIFGLNFAVFSNTGFDAQTHPTLLRVDFDPACGLNAEFQCVKAEVVSAAACDEDGKTLA